MLALDNEAGPDPVAAAGDFAYDEQVVRDFFALLPRTTTEAAQLAGRHDDKVTGDKLWSGEVEERPLRYALEPRHHSFASDEALAALEECDVALVVADSAGKWPRFEQAVGPIVYARLHGDTELYASGYTDSALDSGPRGCAAGPRTGARPSSTSTTT